jgi:hypothetical protein
MSPRQATPVKLAATRGLFNFLLICQLRGAEMGGGPRPTGFFGLSVPT